MSRSKRSLATEEEVQQRCNFVLKLKKAEAYLSYTTLNEINLGISSKATGFISTCELMDEISRTLFG